MVQITQCCCCISLRTGTLIIGALDLVGSILSVLTIVIQAVRYNELSTDAASLENKELHEHLQVIQPWLKAIFFSLLANYSLHIVFSALLIFGVQKRKATYTVPWIVFNIAMIVLVTLAFTGYLIFLVANNGSAMITITIFTAIITWMVFMASIAFSVHLVMVVYSYYKSTKNIYQHVNSSSLVPKSEKVEEMKNI